MKKNKKEGVRGRELAAVERYGASVRTEVRTRGLHLYHHGGERRQRVVGLHLI